MDKEFENKKWDCKWFFRELFYIMYRTNIRYGSDIEIATLRKKISGLEQETKVKRLYSFITAVENIGYNEFGMYGTVFNYLNSFGFSGKNRHRLYDYGIDNPIVAKVKQLYNDNGADFIYDRDIRNSNALLANPEVDENFKECLRENLEKIKQDPDKRFPIYVQQIFEVLCEARLKLEETLHCFSGVMCANLGGHSAMGLVEKLFTSPTKKNIAIVDEILALLLYADKADISFTTKELVKKYHFPTTTDSEIEDWRIDNF